MFDVPYVRMGLQNWLDNRERMEKLRDAEKRARAIGEEFDAGAALADLYAVPPRKTCISCGSATQPCCGH